ncbi:MAG: hypothetical protein HBSAPP04_14510 [Ignavibacteriaceae bacterium]|nr:MAG: protein tyrosine phosphatase [Chlorobiota bacterium]GJQ32612.1 MAG: hypothetical protein HBSAPP04_14510 [Ignavibacteriaceae bacterium]
MQKTIRALSIYLISPLLFLTSCSAEKPAVPAEQPHEITQQSSDTLITHRIGDGEVVFRFQNYRNTGGKVFIVLHDDENTGVEAMNTILKSQKSSFIELRASGTRLIPFRLNGRSYKFDPNRIFTPAGIRKTLANNGGTSPAAEKAVAELANRITGMLEKFDTVIAVHNNRRGYSLQDYLPGGTYARDAADVHWVKGTSPNDFYFVVERDDFEALKAKGINVVLQSAATVTDDGSLSVYCQQKGIRYLNCEAYDGHLSQQIFMLESLGN